MSEPMKQCDPEPLKREIEQLRQQCDELAAALEAANAVCVKFDRWLADWALQSDAKKADVHRAWDRVREGLGDDPAAILRERDERVAAELKQQVAESALVEKHGSADA